MTPKLFRQINQFLARLIYSPDTSEKMRAAAKDARQSLHRLFGTNNKPIAKFGRRKSRILEPSQAK